MVQPSIDPNLRELNYWVNHSENVQSPYILSATICASRNIYSYPMVCAADRQSKRAVDFILKSAFQKKSRELKGTYYTLGEKERKIDRKKKRKKRPTAKKISLIFFSYFSPTCFILFLFFFLYDVLFIMCMFCIIDLYVLSSLVLSCIYSLSLISCILFTLYKYINMTTYIVGDISASERAAIASDPTGHMLPTAPLRCSDGQDGRLFHIIIYYCRIKH